MEITNILNRLRTVGFKVFGLNCMIVKNDCSHTTTAITQIPDGTGLTHPWNRKHRTYLTLFRQHIIECPPPERPGASITKRKRVFVPLLRFIIDDRGSPGGGHSVMPGAISISDCNQNSCKNRQSRVFTLVPSTCCFYVLVICKRTVT